MRSLLAHCALRRHLVGLKIISRTSARQVNSIPIILEPKTMMNSLALYLAILCPGEIRSIDRINFRDSAFVVPKNDTELSEVLEREQGLIFLEELVRSLDGDGLYLIFTSASGIADEGGWDAVKVEYAEPSVLWQFEIGETRFNWSFPVESYRLEVAELKRTWQELPKGIVLEPGQVVFPEHW